jgi:hypothetical protein
MARLERGKFRGVGQQEGLQVYRASANRRALLKPRLEHLEVVVVVTLPIPSFFPAALVTTSLDHLVGEGEHRRRHGEAERLRGLEVDD